MAEREQIRKQTPSRSDEDVVEEAPATNEKGEALKAELEEAFAPFVADGGYELPGVALCAVAS